MRRGLALLLLPAFVWGGALAVAPGASARGKPPVVMLILDEFPTESLLGADGKIDAARYPNFARLASIATWFRNSTTVLDETTGAVPAILDARLPHRGERAELRYHPRSVYTLLGERGYRITDSEEATAICPRRYCPHAPARRPGILPNLNRGRSRRLHAWIDSIRPGRRPGFWIKHALFPHGPWLYLPSGRHTRPGVKDPVPGLGSPAGYGDRGLTGFNEQRYLLQLGYTDRELGALLDQLERTKVLDRAMVVVTADHGFSWEVGVKDRRRLTRSNIDEIGPQPLFIKAPGQRRGRVDRSYVRTVDIVPTMADILGIRVNWRHDGRSAFSRTTRRRRVVRISARDFSRIISIGA
ncbi:MAG: hypothetical protein QOE91_1195, partial [Gaiellaceae bacterium]|nr:hypothetical protein [Gaiellaceae bacterium]